MKPTMKAAVIHQYGQKNLTLEQVDIPTMGAEDVLIKIVAASLNPIDSMIMSGGLKILLKYKMPLILGNDFAVVVEQVGSRVTKFKIGDEVFGRAAKNRIGTFAEYIASNQDDIALKPSNLSLEEAAAIPLVGLTSYQALHDILAVKPNDKVLIQAGAGGVGSMAIQVAKTMGAYVATTTSSKNTDFVKSLGADEVIDYHQTNFEDVLSNYDYVFDTLGGKSLENAFKILKPNGKIVSVSGTPNRRFAQSFGLSWWKTAAITVASRKITKLEKEFKVQYDFLFMKPSGQELAILANLIEQGQVKPIIDHSVTLNNIQDGLDSLRNGRTRGKIVVKVSE